MIGKRVGDDRTLRGAYELATLGAYGQAIPVT